MGRNPKQEKPFVAFFHENYDQHVPPFEVWDGNHAAENDHAETPERAKNILNALRTAQVFELRDVEHAIAPALLESIHAPQYIAFLQRLSESLKGGDKKYHYPSVFPIRDSKSVPTNMLAQQGYYTFDMYTPVSETTFDVALESASLAWQLADAIKKQEIEVGYALCRPPGHHAEPQQMGGYCYFNNAALAAEHLSTSGSVATLDVDIHHGNGTQHIFYDRPDVLTVSIHAHPDIKFPHMSGYAEERGVRDGLGKNINYPLQEGVTDKQFAAVLDQAMSKIHQFNPDYLVVSFGADTFEGDPIGAFKLSSEYFTEMGRTIAQLGAPTAIIQEGGYATDDLGTNVVNFLNGFR